MAEYHFRRALSINAVSSVLRCYLSMSLHAQNDDIKSSEALDILIQACKVDPKNPQVMKIIKNNTENLFNRTHLSYNKKIK